MTDWPLHGVAIYNPDLLSKQELIAQFIARRSLLERLVADLGREGTNQHHLIIGQRGMGKTTLLRRLRYAIDDDPRLAATWVPLTFPEEQYNVARLSDLYLNCADALGDALDRMGRTREARALDAAVAAMPDCDERERAKRALEVLLHGADLVKRRLVLLIDNIDLIFDRLKGEQWAIRELLSSERRLLLIGASAAMLETTYEYKEPFYDFFLTHELTGLSEEETREVLLHLARLGNAPAVARVVEEDPARIKTFHVLAGGNPRTVVLLYDVLAQGVDGDVRADLERLLDRVTPLYKARFEALPAQSQQIVDGLAIHWDPLSAAELAAVLRLEVNVVSSQLSRLEKQGVVEKVAYHPSNKAGFQVAERFFNIWYLMRASRRVRQRLIWLVEFLRLVYGREEISGHAERYLRQPEGRDAESRMRRAEYGLALAQVVEDAPLRRALESVSVHALTIDRKLRAQLAGLIDLEGADASLKPVVDRHKAMAEVREAVFAAKVAGEGWDPERFWELLGGSISLNSEGKAEVAGALDTSSVSQLLPITEAFEQEIGAWRSLFSCAATVDQLRSGFASGHLTDLEDLAAARAAARALDAPEVTTVVLASHLMSNFDPALFDEFLQASRMTRSAYVLSALGELLASRLHRYDEAEAAYRRAIELDPAHEYPWYGLGILLQDQLHRYDEAEAAYRKAIELDSTHVHPWQALGHLLQDHLRRYDEAEAAYRKAIELAPSDGDLWDSLAWCRYLSNKLDASTEEAARQSVALAPDDVHALHTLATILAARDKWLEAEPIARRYLSEGSPQFHDKTWPDTITFFREAARTGHAADAVRILDDLALTDRWRPLREALAAIAAGSKLPLRRIAPELRRPAEELLDQLWPQGLD